MPECHYISHKKHMACMLRTKLFQCLFQSQNVSFVLRRLLPSRQAVTPSSRRKAWNESSLRRVLETFFGLYTAKGENGQKRRPINKIANRPVRSGLLSFLLRSVEALYYAKTHSGRLWSVQNMAGSPKQTVKKTKMLIRSDKAPDRSKNGIRFCPSAVPLATKVRAAFRLCRKRG